MAQEKELIRLDDFDTLKPGDEVVIEFTTFGNTYIKAAQLELLERKIDSDPRLQLVKYSQPEKTKLNLRLRIREPDPGQIEKAGVTGSIVTVGIILSILSGLLWMSADKIYKVVDKTKEIGQTAGGQAAMFGVGSIGIAAGVAILWGLLRK